MTRTEALKLLVNNYPTMKAKFEADKELRLAYRAQLTDIPAEWRSRVIASLVEANPEYFPNAPAIGATYRAMRRVSPSDRPPCDRCDSTGWVNAAVTGREVRPCPECRGGSVTPTQKPDTGPRQMRKNERFEEIGKVTI